MTTALALIQEYGPQALAAVGGVAGVAKGATWAVHRVVETRRTKREASDAWREEVRAGIRACTTAVSGLERQVAVMASQLDAHDRRTAETATLVRQTCEELAALRGEVMHRVEHAENDAGTARHVASEANALATNAHQRLDERIPRTLDTVTPGFGRPRSKG